MVKMSPHPLYIIFFMATISNLESTSASPKWVPMDLEAPNKCANILKGDEDGHIQSSLTIKSYIIMTHELNLISGVSPSAKCCLSMACYHILCLHTLSLHG